METERAVPNDRTAAISQVERRLAHVSGTIRVAHALLEASRPIDLAGLDHEIGALCAGAIDLAPEDGRRFRPALVAVMAECERLTRTLARTREDPT